MHARMYKIPAVQAAREKRERGLKNTLTFIVGSGLSPGSSSLSTPGDPLYTAIYPAVSRPCKNTTECIRGVGRGGDATREKGEWMWVGHTDKKRKLNFPSYVRNIDEIG
jgi:hypothetical protein